QLRRQRQMCIRDRKIVTYYFGGDKLFLYSFTLSDELEKITQLYSLSDLAYFYSATFSSIIFIAAQT
ncbi:hypothetical protein KQJ29_26240, partial [Enterococcus sp. S181_ASV_20]|nr:hypothetical protein [Enterococcus sp. S181_ASV_20]